VLGGAAATFLGAAATFLGAAAPQLVINGMPKALDLTGQRFGRLVARQRAGTSPSGHSLWSCDCSCGTTNHVVTANVLKKGFSRSCGCLRRQFLVEYGPHYVAAFGKPTGVEITPEFAIPDPIYPNKSLLVNQVTRRRYELRWRRVEEEVKRIENGTFREKAPMKQPAKLPPFKPKEAVKVRALPPIDERELYGACILRDRIRVVKEA
jgi:hypothetical protein